MREVGELAGVAQEEMRQDLQAMFRGAIPVPLVGARRRPRGRWAVVRGLDDVPGDTWQVFQEAIPDWRGTCTSQRIRSANRAWDRHHGPTDQQACKRKILPRLANVTLR